MVETQNEKQERALLVGLVTAKQNLQKMQENLDELAFLAETAGAIPVEQVYQNLHLPDNRTYVGSGKLAEIKQMIRLKAIIIDGKSLRYMLIEKGFAREYYGDKKESWC